jgi:cation diffusion facilitator family transporter
MPDQDYQQGLRISLVGMFVNAGLGVIKLLGGLLGNSTALVADAIESLTDLLSSLVVLSGLQIARQPPDEDHPYGHGRAESLAALVVAVMLFGAGFGVAVEAISGIFDPGGLPAAFTLWVLIGVILVKETMFQLARRTARATGSSLVLTDAWHHRSDALTSVAAAVGIGIALWGGEPYAAADDWAALVAAGVILFNAARILRPPLHELMDREQPEIVAEVRRVAADVPGVAGVEKTFARKSGLRYLVDMHIEVNREMPVWQAHGVGHDVKEAIRRAMPTVQDVLVHVEPHEAGHPRGREESADDDLQAAPNREGPQ